MFVCVFFFFSSRRRHTRSLCDWSSDVCSSDLEIVHIPRLRRAVRTSQFPRLKAVKTRYGCVWMRKMPVSQTSYWQGRLRRDRKSTRLNSSHTVISYAVFCLKKKKKKKHISNEK